MASAGPNAPGTMATVSRSKNSWGDPDKAKASDNSYTASGPQSSGSDYLVATNFGFSIPAGSTINGVTVAVERKSSSNIASSYIKDDTAYLMKGGSATGDNKADTSTKWPTSDTVATYGGAADVWGATLSVDDVNASTFGFRLSDLAYRTGKGSPLAYVDFISITVTYTEGGGGASAVPAIMNQYRQRRA